jgi:hypothetical protein
MIEFHRISIATITMIVLCAASFWASVIAQDVFDSSITIEPPKPADAEVVDTIRKALSDDPEARHSDDPILDDVLQIINQRGSILDGSSLDIEPAAGPRPSTDVGSKALAAERLLKAARLLEQIEPQDHSRRDLVKEMRRETVRLLSE